MAILHQGIPTDLSGIILEPWSVDLMLSSSGNSHGCLPCGAKNYFQRNKEEEFPKEISFGAYVHLPDPHH